jgi:hypothetical protein
VDRKDPKWLLPTTSHLWLGQQFPRANSPAHVSDKTVYS